MNRALRDGCLGGGWIIVLDGGKSRNRPSPTRDEAPKSGLDTADRTEAPPGSRIVNGRWSDACDGDMSGTISVP